MDIKSKNKKWTMSHVESETWGTFQNHPFQILAVN